MFVLKVRCGFGVWLMMKWLGSANILGLWFVVSSSVVILCFFGICMVWLGSLSLMFCVVVCSNRCSGELCRSIFLMVSVMRFGLEMLWCKVCSWFGVDSSDMMLLLNLLMFVSWLVLSSSTIVVMSLCSQLKVC